MASVSWISPPAPASWVGQQLEDLRLQDVAAGDEQVGGLGPRRAASRPCRSSAPAGRRSRPRLAERDDAVLVRLALRRRLDHDDVAADRVVGGDRLGQRRRIGAPSACRAGSPRTARRRSRRGRTRPRGRGPAAPSGARSSSRRAWPGRRGSSARSSVLPLASSCALELELVVEIVLDRALAAAGDEDEVLDARRPGLGDHVATGSAGRTTLSRFFGRGLGGRQHAGAEPGHRQDGLADRFHDSHAPSGGGRANPAASGGSR